jgi:flavorubredoxin
MYLRAHESIACSSPSQGWQHIERRGYSTKKDRDPQKEENMEEQVLIAYATKYGATAEIAEKIGEVLRGAGLAADVRTVENAGDLGAYRAVILGSAVYIGQWRKEAARFLKDNEVVLAQKPVWIFSSGPTGEGDPVQLTDGWRLPGKLQPHRAPRHRRLSRVPGCEQAELYRKVDDQERQSTHRRLS